MMLRAPEPLRGAPEIHSFLSQGPVDNSEHYVVAELSMAGQSLCFCWNTLGDVLPLAVFAPAWHAFG